MRVSMATLASRREDLEGKIIKHRALFAGKIGCGATRRLASAARRRRTCANEADEKVNIYKWLGSLHHSHVISANPAWIKVAERSVVCLERRVRRIRRLDIVMSLPPFALQRRSARRWLRRRRTQAWEASPCWRWVTQRTTSTSSSSCRV